jgi:hypothetical protein
MVHSKNEGFTGILNMPVYRNNFMEYYSNYLVQELYYD